MLGFMRRRSAETMGDSLETTPLALGGDVKICVGLTALGLSAARHPALRAGLTRNNSQVQQSKGRQKAPFHAPQVGGDDGQLTRNDTSRWEAV